uniref:Uncharacterized protein n=1 Tax=Phocoena sinus TaxID=42100 RepID=A0A8C9C0J8_PHOSS
MEVFLMIRCHKTTIFTDVKEQSNVIELKWLLEEYLSPAHLSCLLCVMKPQDSGSSANQQAV